MKYKFVWGRYIIDLLVIKFKNLIDVSGEWNFTLLKFFGFQSSVMEV